MEVLCVGRWQVVGSSVVPGAVLPYLHSRHLFTGWRPARCLGCTGMQLFSCTALLLRLAALPSLSHAHVSPSLAALIPLPAAT